MLGLTSVNKQVSDIASGKVCLNVVFRKAEIDGGYIAECLELPGCMSQGDTEAEAKANIVDAIEACISVLVEDYLKSTIINRTTDFGNVERQATLILDPQVREAFA
jgi:predicted RNase H-like HicB family nuclease